MGEGEWGLERMAGKQRGASVQESACVGRACSRGEVLRTGRGLMLLIAAVLALPRAFGAVLWHSPRGVWWQEGRRGAREDTQVNEAKQLWCLETGSFVDFVRGFSRLFSRTSRGYLLIGTSEVPASTWYLVDPYKTDEPVSGNHPVYQTVLE